METRIGPSPLIDAFINLLIGPLMARFSENATGPRRVAGGTGHSLICSGCQTPRAKGRDIALRLVPVRKDRAAISGATCGYGRLICEPRPSALRGRGRRSGASLPQTD